MVTCTHQDISREHRLTYHKADKRISVYKTWSSNRDACESVGVSIFHHLVAACVLNQVISICVSESPCSAKLRYF